jgi:hypothetical protein
LNLKWSKFVSRSEVLKLKNKAPHFWIVRESSVEYNEIFIDFNMLDVEETAVLHHSNADLLSLNSYGKIATTWSRHRDPDDTEKFCHRTIFSVARAVADNSSDTVVTISAGSHNSFLH